MANNPSIEDIVKALAPAVYQKMAGAVVPLPITPGPQAGRPTNDEILQGFRQHLPAIAPKTGTHLDNILGPPIIGPRGN